MGRAEADDCNLSQVYEQKQATTNAGESCAKSIFIVIFLLMAGAFTFYLGGFFERDQADLNAFLQFHPWLYVVLIPAISMRLWAEEINAGTIELLMTLPITTTQAVIGKFLASQQHLDPFQEIHVK